MMYYSSGEAKKISREKFKKIFGISYKKSENSGISFEDAHCSIDPYNEDIYGTITPIVCQSKDSLDDEINLAYWEC